MALEFFHWKGLGINTHTAFDFKDVNNIEQRVGFAYSPNLFDLDLNVAIGISAGTPIVKPFKQYSINTDLIFYLNN